MKKWAIRIFLAVAIVAIGAYSGLFDSTIAWAAANIKLDRIPTVGGGRQYYNITDEDDMTSNLATAIPTQQSVKAYVDTFMGVYAGNTLSVWISDGGSIFAEGATKNNNETIIGFTDPSADVRYIWPTNAAGGTYYPMVSTLATNQVGIDNSVTGLSNAIEFEGTSNAYDTRITATDSTVGTDTYILPNNAAASASYALMFSTLTTNALNAANSIWGGTNGLYFSGLTAGSTNVTLLTVTDPTEARTFTLPDTSGHLTWISDAAWNSAMSSKVYTASTETRIAYEGTADGNESELIFVDPVADVLFYLSGGTTDTAVGIALSTVYSNAIDAANSCWLGDSAYICEGNTADGYENTLAFPSNSVADRTYTLPDATGSVPLVVLTEGATVADGNSVSSGWTVSDYTVPAAAWVSGTSVSVKCAGVITGTNNSKTLYIDADGQTATETVAVAANAGDYVYSATVVYDSATSYRSMSTLVVDGSTIEIADSAHVTGATITGDLDLTVVGVLDSGTDTVNNTLCVWTFEP